VVYWGLLLAATPVMGLASWLHRNTHHRPLGAVTFVLFTAAVLLVAVLVARRCRDRGPTLWLVCRVAAIVSLLAPVLVLLLSLAGH
jgi:hypothetical protein